MIARILIKFIEVYQKTLSPDHGPLRAYYPNGFCRYYPSCSEYSRQALETRGLLAGLFLTLKRILKCNPFSRGGFDHVSQK